MISWAFIEFRHNSQTARTLKNIGYSELYHYRFIVILCIEILSHSNMHKIILARFLWNSLLTVNYNIVLHVLRAVNGGKIREHTKRCIHRFNLRYTNLHFFSFFFFIIFIHTIKNVTCICIYIVYPSVLWAFGSSFYQARLSRHIHAMAVNFAP